MTIDLSRLSAGFPALTEAIGMTFAEAAAVCLRHKNHTSPVQANVITGVTEFSVELIFPAVTDQMTRSWADIKEATEAGAVGIAILVICRTEGLTVVERSVKGTGVDYWLGSEGDSAFQRKARLEVSGTLDGSDSVIKQRIRQKTEQTKPSDTTRLPAYVVVVGFSRPTIEVAFLP